MAIREEKKNKMEVKPEEKANITTRRSFDLWTDIDQLFDNFRSDFDEIFWPWSERGQMTIVTPKRTPPMNVADMGDHYEMKLEMPGIPKEKINIEITPNSIEVKADYDENREKKGKNWLHRECSSMSYYRSLELPKELKTDEAEAGLKEGILKLNLPKIKPKPEYKTKKVKIK